MVKILYVTQNPDRMKNYLRYFVFALCIVSGLVSGLASSVRLSVSAMRGQREIHVGDMFYISYEISDLEASPEKPSSVPGANVVYFDRTGQSSRFSSVNGKVSQSFSYTYTLTLRAKSEGEYTFGPVNVGGTQSNSVHYTILPKGENNSRSPQVPSANSAGSSNDSNKPKFIGKGDGNLFLKAEISRNNAYPQEALVYTVKLYTTYDAIKFIGATAAPKFEGFVVEESDNISTSLEYETVNGKSYATAIIARYIIFPQMEGQLKIKGNTYTVSVDEREYYHDPFWGSMSVAKPLQLNVTPNDLTVNIKPLPTPVPVDFCGGVGQFKISSSLPSESFVSNTAATIEYTVSGTGNLKYITMPDLNKLYPPELEVYSPTTQVDVKVGKTNVTGSVVFDYTFMPLEAGSYTIPNVTLTYFNPLTGKYETSRANGFPINVSQGKGSDKSQTKDALSFNPELLKIKNNLSPELVPLVETFGYWFIFYIIPFALLICIILYYRHYLEINSDIVLVRSRKASKIARQRLRKAEICMKKNNTEEFYDTMLESIWGYLSDRLNIPKSELNRANIMNVFAEKGINEKIASNVISIVDDCEFYKYSSAGASSDMSDIYERAVKVIDDMEEALKNKKNEKDEN